MESRAHNTGTQEVNAQIRMKDSDEILYRDSHSVDDIGFIVSTWLQGLYHGNDWFKQIDRDTYFDFYKKVVKSLVHRPTVKLKICCLKDNTDVILGYSVVEEKDHKKILHWVFVKPVWRKQGIAKVLIPKDIEVITHLTKWGKQLKPKEWIFNPFLN